MYSHAYPNVLNERDPGRQSGAPVGIGPGSLSPHRALISLLPACLLILLLLLFQRQWVAHELCGHIDQLIESYCLEPWVIIEGGITRLLFCVCMWESVLLSSLSQHILPLAHLRFAMAAQKCTHSYTQSTYSSLHNQHGPNDCLHWLPSLCNYVPIVYFLASYSFKWNSIIIALFNVKVSKSGGCGTPVAALSLSVSMTPPKLLCFIGPC